MPTYRLAIEYDGTRYHGWQEQRNARTVAGELKAALRAIAPFVDLAGAGRTDAGVHALEQSASLRLRERVDPDELRDELNARLPSDIHVLTLRAAADDFHARHSARLRSYLYQIALRRTAFAKRHVWWVRATLDIAGMEAAAAVLPGRHDFVRFAERAAEQPSTLVEVDRVEVARSGSLVLVRFVASHFLWKMVRRLVGALVKAGEGALTPDDLRALLSGGSDRVGAGAPAQWTAPASGLFLERVLYEGDPPLAPLAPAIPVRAATVAATRAVAPPARPAGRGMPPQRRTGRPRS